MKETDKLPADTTINLNQYNVYAYKKILRQLDVTPDWSALAQSKFKIDEVGYGVSKRVTKNGKYLGGKVSYNLKHDEAKAAVEYIY